MEKTPKLLHPCVAGKNSKQAVRKALRRIGITKPHKAKYLLHILLGDALAPDDLNQTFILQRYDQYVS